MRLILALLLGISLASPAIAKVERYEIDKSHTNIMFLVSHMGFSQMVGLFTDYDGHFTFDEAAPEQSSVEIALKPSGIRTSSTGLDEHLQKEDFFNSAKFPEIKFTSRSIKVTGEKTGDITGDLTMLGVTKPVVLHVTFNKADYHPMKEGYVAGFSAEATIKRSDFGMTTYIPTIGDEVKLVVHTEGLTMEHPPRPTDKTN